MRFPDLSHYEITFHPCCFLPVFFLKEINEGEDKRYTFIGYKRRPVRREIEHEDMTNEIVTDMKLWQVSICLVFLLVNLRIHNE